jgi:hypothetical protein
MCGYPWALRRDPPALLASPVPSPPRYGGRAAYVTDFIVHADSPHATLADTFGGAIAYSTEHSHSGYNAPRYHLLAHLTSERHAFYRAVLGPFVRQRPCLDAVVKGEADVAAIDSYAKPAAPPRPVRGRPDSRDRDDGARAEPAAGRLARRRPAPTATHPHAQRSAPRTDARPLLRRFCPPLVA